MSVPRDLSRKADRELLRFAQDALKSHSSPWLRLHDLKYRSIHAVSTEFDRLIMIPGQDNRIGIMYHRRGAPIQERLLVGAMEYATSPS